MVGIGLGGGEDGDFGQSHGLLMDVFHDARVPYGIKLEKAVFYLPNLLLQL